MIFHNFYRAVIEANKNNFFGRWDADFNDLFFFYMGFLKVTYVAFAYLGN